MSLTTGRGPLGTNRAGRFTTPIPDGVAYVEPHARRVRAVVDGATVIDTEDVLLVHRPGATLVYAFPNEAIGDLPHVPLPEADGYVEVRWDSVDEWYEEGRRLVDYPPNPYHRVDCRPTRRRLVVTAQDHTLVDTDDTVILFETALDAKLYVRPDLVRGERLRRSDRSTYCNYKGWATYWDLHPGGDGAAVPAVAWSYEDPLPESEPIRGLLSFDPTLVQVSAELPQSPQVP